VTAALERILGLFVAPAGREERRISATAATVPAAIGVLAAGGSAMPAATAVALAVITRGGSRCALVCRWAGDGPSVSAPRAAVPSARALAVRLSGRGLAAAARGRLVVVELAADPVEACAALERACAAAGDLPLVVLVAGPRPAAFDGVLGSLDRLIVVPPDEASASLTELALADAARVGRATGVLRHAPSPWTRVLAAGGVVVGPGLRAAAKAALDGRDE